MNFLLVYLPITTTQNAMHKQLFPLMSRWDESWPRSGFEIADY